MVGSRVLVEPHPQSDRRLHTRREQEIVYRLSYVVLIPRSPADPFSPDVHESDLLSDSDHVFLSRSLFTLSRRMTCPPLPDYLVPWSFVSLSRLQCVLHQRSWVRGSRETGPASCAVSVRCLRATTCGAEDWKPDLHRDSTAALTA